MRLIDKDSSLGIIFIALGAAYTAIGLSHKKDWKKNHIPNKNQKWKMIVSIGLGILVLAGLIVIYFIKKNTLG